MLVTLEQARNHVYAFPHDDAQLSLYLSAAEQIAQDFLNRKVYADADALAEAVLDGTADCDPIIVNDAIKAAILLLVGHLYRNREEVTGESLTQLPMGVHSLLWPHRVGLGV